MITFWAPMSGSQMDAPTFQCRDRWVKYSLCRYYLPGAFRSLQSFPTEYSWTVLCSTSQTHIPLWAVSMSSWIQIFSHFALGDFMDHCMQIMDISALTLCPHQITPHGTPLVFTLPWTSWNPTFFHFSLAIQMLALHSWSSGSVISRHSFSAPSLNVPFTFHSDWACLSPRTLLPLQLSQVDTFDFIAHRP